MSTGTTWETDCTNLEQTLALAESIGRRLKGGEVIELVSDLGGGKTNIVRGMARGLGSSDTVSSPSFTLNNVYQTGNLTMYHFDFYRLNEPGIMREELAEVLADPQAVTVIEWADIVEDVLPAERLTIKLKTTGETSRRLSFSYPGELAYLVPGAGA